MYRAVIFDFDGTLIDSETHLFEEINAHLIAHDAKPISLAFYQQSIGGAAHELQQYLTHVLGEADKAKIYEAHHAALATLPLRDGMEALMQQLKQCHIPMGIATSSYLKDIQPALEALDIAQYMDVVIGREFVSEVKPNPEPYLTAVQALHFSPTHCLAIEDSVNGATAAMHAGLDVIINTNPITERQDFSEINYVAKDIDASQIFENYMQKGE